VALAALFLAGRASADGAPPAAVATLQCDHPTEPGRVRCAVEARARAGLTIQWGDVAIARAPEFAAPLKGRVGPRDATTKDDAVWRWTFALVAKSRGRGELRARVHLVVCEGDAGDRCAPHVVDAVVPLVVGP
jgi:hypothetical protein